MWQDWVNGILGLWVIIMALTSYTTSTTVVVVTGGVIAIVGFWGALQKSA
ncbi:MAG TPA: hypothetical protein PK539_02525 [Candidatus Paceibacterota bacterium]|nr:hypothetical protein [Candidatus Paceibacterota bacterium]